MGKINNKDWSILSKYRNEIYGISIIGIIILHYFNAVLKSDIEGIRRIIATAYFDIIGSSGVDVFLILSGMGLYFSMRKNDNILNFYARRCKKILIAYIIWGGSFWFIREIVLLNRGYKSFFYNFSFLSFWNDGVTSLWFIAFILLMYAVYPFLNMCLKKENPHRTGLCIWMIIGCMTMIEIFKVYTPEFYMNAKLAIYRLPVFIIGVYYGSKIYEKKPFDIVDLITVIVGLLSNLVLVLSKSMNLSFIRRVDVEYIRAIYSIALVIIFAWVFDYVKNSRVSKVLKATGMLSLELYMTHVNIGNIMNVLGLNLSVRLNYAICVVLAIIMSLLLKYVCNGTMKLFTRIKNSREVVANENALAE